jgi:hypothetical protein
MHCVSSVILAVGAYESFYGNVYPSGVGGQEGVNPGRNLHNNQLKFFHGNWSFFYLYDYAYFSFRREFANLIPLSFWTDMNLHTI